MAKQEAERQRLLQEEERYLEMRRAEIEAISNDSTEQVHESATDASAADADNDKNGDDDGGSRKRRRSKVDYVSLAQRLAAEGVIGNA